MSIIVSEEGENARKLDPTALAREEFLQTYIKNNPHTIPISEIKEDLRLLVLAREFQTKSGPIDALGADQEGNLYVIETKRAKNPDKRYVLAQVLDYGAALWRAHENGDEFVIQLEQAVEKIHNTTLSDKVREFFADEIEDVAAWLQTLRERLRSGDFRFVVLMDRIEDRLKNLITFVSRNSQFTIYGVEMEFYKFDKYEILIPKLFGAEVTKEVSAPRSTGSQQRWDEESFFERAENVLIEPEVASLRNLYDFSKRHGEIKWQANQSGSFSVKFPHLNPNRAFYTVYSDGKLKLHLDWHDNERATAAADELRQALKRLPGLDDGKNFELQNVTLKVGDWTPQAKGLILAMMRVAGAPNSDGVIGT